MEEQSLTRKTGNGKDQYSHSFSYYIYPNFLKFYLRFSLF